MNCPSLKYNMLRKTFYPKVESFLRDCAQILDKQGFTPNQLTLGGCAINFLAGCIYASGNLFLAGFIVLVAGIGDILDGPLARLQKKPSRFGAFLDSTIDRYSDFFIFGGIAAFYAKQGEGLLFLLTMGILMGSFVTSYAKSRAETLGDPCKVGIFERAERVILVAVASIVWPLLPLTIWVLFFGTNFTALQRIFHVKQAFGEKKPVESNTKTNEEKV